MATHGQLNLLSRNLLICAIRLAKKRNVRERAWSIAKGEHFMLPCTTYQDADKKVDGPKKEALSTPGTGKEVVC